MNGIFYRDRAQLHAPKTPTEIVQAAQDLKNSGFSILTIAAILRTDALLIREILGEQRA